MTDQLQRDLGRHDARLDAMEKDIQQMQSQLNRMNELLAQIQETLATAAGGWKTLLVVGGMIAAVIQGIGWLLDNLLSLSHK